MKHTVKTVKEAVERFYTVPTNDNARKCKEEIEGFEKELLDKLVNEKGIVTINDDDSTRDVLIGIKEILGQ